MGVPGLWPFLKRRYSYAITRFLREQYVKDNKFFEFDYIYLDSNCLLHAAAQHIENYGENKRVNNPYKNKTKFEKQLLIFERFFNNIIDIITIIRPKKLLYIAIDGPAPRAKQNQQRERRFLSALNRKKDVNNIEGDYIFDSSSITPGTEFMHELSKFMYWKIRSIMCNCNENNLSFLNDVDVIFSSHTVPGEGEHKIMNYIRTLTKEERNFSTHCMFGPDADLLMLTLTSYVKNMFLFREDQFEIGYLDLVNMKKVKSGIARTIDKIGLINNKIKYYDDLSNDFVFIGFFLGNDFLPKIKMFYRLEEGLQRIIDLYIDILEKEYNENVSKNRSIGSTYNRLSFLTYKNHISYNGLLMLITKLSEFEKEYISKQLSIIHEDERFKDKTLIVNSVIPNPKLAGILNIDNNNLDMISYRKAYYKKAGIIYKDNEKEYNNSVMKMCKDYVKNLIWTYEYYTNKLLSWNEAYEWHYAPLMEDLKHYLLSLKTSQNFVNEITKFDLSHPSLPFEQLLSVLSLYSADLLPEFYRPLMISENSPLVKLGYYPKVFDIDYEGVHKEHEGIALLPFVKYSEINKEYNIYAKKDKYEYHKNTFSKEYLFKKDGENTIIFESEYGNIDDCDVVGIAI